MTKETIIKESKKHTWQISHQSFLQDNPRQPYFGKVMARLMYFNSDDGNQIGIDMYYDSYGDADSKESIDSLYFKLCRLVNERYSEKQ